MKNLGLIIFSLIIFSSCQESLEGIWYNNDNLAIYLSEKHDYHTVGKDTFKYEIIGDTIFSIKRQDRTTTHKYSMIHSDTIIIENKKYYRGVPEKIEYKYLAIIDNEHNEISFISISDDQVLILTNPAVYANLRRDLHHRTDYKTFKSGENLFVSVNSIFLRLLPINQSAVSQMISSNPSSDKKYYVDLSDFRIQKDNYGYKGNNYVDNEKSDGWLLEWHPNGLRKYQCFFIAKEKYGYETMWDEDGKVTSHEYYWASKRNGLSITFPSKLTGGDYRIANYEDDQLHGKFEGWSSSYETGNYRNNRKIGRWKYITKENNMMISENNRKYYGYRSKMPSFSNALMEKFIIYMPYSDNNINESKNTNFSIEIGNSIQYNIDWIGAYDALMAGSVQYMVFESNQIISVYSCYYSRTDRSGWVEMHPTKLESNLQFDQYQLKPNGSVIEYSQFGENEMERVW